MLEFLAFILVVACGLLGGLAALIAKSLPTPDAKPPKKASDFQLEMKDERDLYGKRDRRIRQQPHSFTTTSALSSPEPFQPLP
jgi:hypothetical protein